MKKRTNKRPPLVLVKGALTGSTIKTFEGTACTKCGSTERYVNSNNCANCNRTANKKYRYKRNGYTNSPTKGNKDDTAESQERLAKLKSVSKEVCKTAPIEVLETAKRVMRYAGRGYYHNGLYYVDHKPVSIGNFLRAANELIAAGEAGDVTKLLGERHDRWGV